MPGKFRVQLGLIMTMLSDAEEKGFMFDKIVQKIRSVSDPEAIVLFGSRARGDASEQSDFDLLVIMESDLPRYRRAVPIRKALTDIISRKDIIVYTPSEVNEWRTAGTSIVATALREGRVLYEKRH